MNSILEYFKFNRLLDESSFILSFKKNGRHYKVVKKNKYVITFMNTDIGTFDTEEEVIEFINNL